MKTKRETKELGMDTHLGEGVVKGEKFQNTRKPSHWWVCGSFGVSEGNVSRKRKKKKKKQEYAHNHNSQWRSSPDAPIHHQ